MLRPLIQRWRRLSRLAKGMLMIGGLATTAACGYFGLFIYSQFQSNSSEYIRRWFDDRSARAELATTLTTPCPGAPFLLPSAGLIGLLWGDPAGPYNVFNRHTGIDIFGNGDPGEVPVIAAYGGYLTRLPDWVSTVIIRHEDPLEPGRTIWTYYTHMASRDGDSFIVKDFPPGTTGKWVEQGTLLGYQGEYSGNSVAPIGLHVHFSIVKSEPDGSFKNESQLGNTLDPTPYLGMPLNIKEMPIRPIVCDERVTRTEQDET